MSTELQELLKEWGREAEGTIAVMQALPKDQYDFRPDPSGRSIGELAWHLAEIDGYLSFGIAQHFCLGVHLARLEGRVFFEELLSMYPTIEKAGASRRIRSNLNNGLKTLPIRLGRA